MKVTQLIVPLLAVVVTGCATTPDVVPDTVPTPAETPAETPNEDLAAVSDCEEFFQSINRLSGGAEPSALSVAAARIDREAEGCRAVFKAAAKTPGSAVIADGFVDLMHLRGHDFRMTLKSAASETDTVCESSNAALKRASAMRDYLREALDTEVPEPTVVTDEERAVLSQLYSAAHGEVDALEPFIGRGCDGDTFVPERFVSVDDLSVSTTMSADACKHLVVALAAFDMESAEATQTQKLATLLGEAAKPCRATLIPDSSLPATTEDLEQAALAELIEGGPLLIGASLAIAAQQMPVACQAMSQYITHTDGRIGRLTTVVQGGDVPHDVRVHAGAELEVATQTLRQFKADHAALCSL